MEKKYLAKIIAKDTEGLKIISAFCSGATIEINNLKYLKKNKIFLCFLNRIKKEDEKKNQIIQSVCKFEYVESVKSKNINQKKKTQC